MIPVSCKELDWEIRISSPDSANIYDRPNSDIQDLCSVFSIISGSVPIESYSNPKSAINMLKVWAHLNDSSHVDMPAFMFDYDAGHYYWTVNGEWLIDDGHRIPINDTSLTPRVKYADGEWFFSCGLSEKWQPIDATKPTSIPVLHIEDSESDMFFSLIFPSGHTVSLLTQKGLDQLNKKVPQKSFYKDIFLDSGIGLKKWKNLYAAKYLGLSVEGTLYEEKEDYILQSKVIAGSDMDENGWLLYPDGQPRYRMLFVVGGDSRTHGEFLGERGLKPMRTFIRNGGVYVGTCAGCFFVSNGYDSNQDYVNYLNMWPGMVKHSGIASASIGMTLPDDSPLLKYYDYGGDFYVEKIRHLKGGYPIEMPKGTEVLASVDFPAKETFHQQPAIWAYKEDSFHGRICMTGSHPEMTASGEVRDLMAAIMRYALEGQGYTTVKGFLHNGETRIMDKSFSDNFPAFTKIGDRQCHHFAVIIPEGARNVSVSLEGAPDFDLTLMMDPETYAYPDVAHFISDIPGPVQKLEFEALEAGIWYIAVQCLTTVDVNDFKYGQEYSGKTDVLNGVPYSITVTWEDTEQTAGE